MSKRTFTTMPGGRIKRISNRHGGEEGFGHNTYGRLRRQQARMAVLDSEFKEADADNPDENDVNR